MLSYPAIVTSKIRGSLTSRQRLSGHRSAFVNYGYRAEASPFEGGPELVVHCTHHKAGTLWLQSILKILADVYALPFKSCPQVEWTDTVGFFLQDHSEIDPDKLPDFVGSHLIRDPRDMAVSAYFYHKWCDEPWVHVPLPEYGGTTLQKYLNGLSQDEGLMVEIRRGNKRDIRGIKRWSYADPRFFELKYEDLITDPQTHFTALFTHYGLNQEALALGLKIADDLHFDNRTRRSMGKEKKKSHMRSGKPGQWRDYFTEAQKDLFKETHGDLLVRLGYERDNNW